MTRQQFEAALVKSPDNGTAGEVVFDFRSTPQAPCPEFRYVTSYVWNEDGLAMEECWQAYLGDWEAEWID